eukprot:3109836-Amphidinium_carterae.1
MGSSNDTHPGGVGTITSLHRATHCILCLNSPSVGRASLSGFTPLLHGRAAVCNALPAAFKVAVSFGLYCFVARHCYAVCTHHAAVSFVLLLSPYLSHSQVWYARDLVLG